MMLRNTSEELLIRSFVDGSMNSTSNTCGMDNLGLLAPLPSSVRNNSEELFNFWIANSAAPEGSVHNNRQPRKMSSELSALLAHQKMVEQAESRGKPSNPDYATKRNHELEFPSLQALSWFQSSQPMTRSRSTELRKRYLEQQRAQGLQVQTQQGHVFGMNNNVQQNSSSVTTVVNMLKGSLERKKQKSSNGLAVCSGGMFIAGDLLDPLTPTESSCGCDNSCETAPNYHFSSFHDTGHRDAQGEHLEKAKGQLSRAGSITSSGISGVDVSSDTSTKKRRVQRKRMMDEAKGRSTAPPLPADYQATLKRCEALEKEVRSLKLNLSFMNRKDSEQTKKIEELELQNEKLLQEKGKLTRELEQLASRRTW